MAEGVARSLNPKANMWHLAKPLASDWVQSQTGFAFRIKHIFSDLERLFSVLPNIIEKYERNANEKDTEKNNSKKFVFLSYMGWFIAGVSATIAFITFYR